MAAADVATSLALVAATAMAGGALGSGRPRHERAALRAMLAAGAAGMLAGLWLDLRHVGLGWLSAWCGGLSWSSLPRHWQALPGMHAGMLLAGGMTCMRRRTKQAGPLCSIGMILGMDLGALLCRIPQGGAIALLAAMLAGMAWGAIAGDTGDRLWGRVRRCAFAQASRQMPEAGISTAGLSGRGQVLPRYRS